MDTPDFVLESPDGRLDGLPEIRTFGEARHQSAEPRLPPHFNPGIEICLCRAGVYRWNVEGEIVEIKPGELSITRPWEKHSGVDNVLGPGRLSWMILNATGDADGNHIHSPSLDAVLRTDSPRVRAIIAESPTHHLGQLPAAVRAFDRLSYELPRTEPGRLTAAKASVSLLLVSVVRRLVEPRADSPDRTPEGVLQVLRDVGEAPDREWTTSAMAGRAGLGVTAFTDWCRRLTGRSPRWYLLQERLELARRLLRESTRTVTEIALQTGFSSSQHFSTSFKRLYGQTPSEFRERAAGVDDLE